MPEPLAFFLTWTTYGTWLPGDERGWVKDGKGFQLSNPVLATWTLTQMTESACKLSRPQRALVEQTITDHCRIRGWHLYAVQCRTNHVHVVVAADRAPDDVREQLKAWCTRRLREEARSYAPLKPVRRNWWTEKGSCRFVGDKLSLETVITYVTVAQDRKHLDVEE